MKVLLFGTGDYYERYKKWFDKAEVLALLDNSPHKQNKLLDGIRVLPPSEGIKLPFDFIVILSFYVKSMKKQLLELGVSDDRIYHFYNLGGLIDIKKKRKPVRYYGNAELLAVSENSREKKLLLMSQDMELGGATIALFHAAVILAENQYNVVFASMIDGPLKDRLLSNNIPVVVDVNLQLEVMKDADWVRDFSLIFCNTINFHVFLSERVYQIPVIWWLHDAAFFYDGIDSAVLRKINRANMRIYAVGPIPENAIKGFIPDIEVERLLYGTLDTVDYTNNSEYKHSEKLCFVTIGDIGQIKGQDILLQSIRLLSEELRRKAVFYMVGRNTSMLAQSIKDEIGDLPEIVMTGIVDREGVNEILNEADVLICPSREDSMPTVAAEAMMHQAPCIVSDATGTAGYIQNGVDGFVFRSEDTQDLSEKIRWCIENKEKLYDMGIRSRKIYDKYFSMEVFEENLLDIVNGLL